MRCKGITRNKTSKAAPGLTKGTPGLTNGTPGLTNGNLKSYFEQQSI